MSRLQRMFLEALIFIGLAAATYVAVGRVMVEQTNRTIGLAVDYREAEELAASIGQTPASVLASLRSAGATHLAVTEDSLQSLLSRGQAVILSRGDTVEILLDSAGRLLQVAEALDAKLPGDYVRLETEDGGHWLVAPAAVTSVLNIGLGYPRGALQAAQQAGLEIVARPHWQAIRTRQAVSASVEQAAEAGARLVVFTGDQVVGYPNLIDATVAALTQHQMTFGLIELTPQNGATQLASKLKYRVVRVHSITEPEMHTISPRRAVERFARAAHERNVRLLYLRLLPGAEADPLQANVEYVTTIKGSLRAAGLRTGVPVPFADFHTAPWLLVLVRVAVCGGGLWLIQALFGLPPRYFWALTLLILAGGSAAVFVATGLVRSVAALAAAVVFPVLAVLYVARGTMAARVPQPRLLTALGPLLGAFLKVAVVTAFGGLLVVGILGDSSYLTKVAQFRGVKLSQVIPLAAVALVWLARSTSAYRDVIAQTGPNLVDYRSGLTQAEWPALWRGLRQAFRQLVAYWHVAAAILGAALLAVLIIRSGNEPGVGVLPLELQFRALLDKLLVVRPRTKEVFVGHPVMILTLLLALRGIRRGLWIGFTIGTIGQISLVNSFCHLHTPLLVTLVRVFNGLWVGALAGIVLCIIWDVLGARSRGPSAAASPGGLSEEQE